MTAPTHVRFIAVALFIVIPAGQSLAQGTMHRQTADSETTDSSGHLKTGGASGRAVIRGSVVFSTGEAPQQLVSLIAVCDGEQIVVATTDSKGGFSFSPAKLAGVTKASACLVRASLDGYRSTPATIADIHAKSEVKLGKFVLKPLAEAEAGLTSVNDAQAPKAARKHYLKALDQAAEGQEAEAVASLQKAIAAYPDYSSAWLTLGLLEVSRNERDAAHKSFLEAVRADTKLALPLIQAAKIEASIPDWAAVLHHSEKAIAMNPGAFPNAYALNAAANVSFQNIEAAEKSAREGLRLDDAHEYPELEYSLGIVLYSKGETGEAAKHLRSYLALAPHGPNADAARGELAQSAAVAQKSAEPTSPAAEPADNQTAAPGGPSVDSLQAKNAPLLVSTPSHTCLESISRIQYDARGRAHSADLTRVDIAVSDGHEIYGYIDGKRFSNERLAAMLGNTFSTTGIYSSLARALIAGNGVSIVFAGEEMVRGETLLKFTFKGLPAQALWSLQHGKDSGSAGEAGFFLVDRDTLVLRRIAVHSVQMPTALKLKQVEAIIDYEQLTIAGRRVLLPQSARVHVVEASGTEHESRMLFNHCRAFGAESALIVDTGGASEQAVDAARKPDLPADLEITVSLQSPIHIPTAPGSGADDVVTAVVTEPVISRGHELVPAGAIVEGHARPVRGEHAVVIEFDRIQTHLGPAPFYARLVNLLPADAAGLSHPLSLVTDPRGGQLVRGFVSRSSAERTELADPDVPGVAKIDLGEAAALPAGLRMVWKTEVLAAPSNIRPPEIKTTVSMQ